MFLLWTKIKSLESGAKNIEPREEKAQQQQQAPGEPQVLGEQLESTIGNFKVTGDEICREDGKPIIYYFGSSGCPHCIWEHPVVEKVIAKFTGYISVHDNMDKQGVDMDIFQQYREINRGGIPFLLFGCHYARPGSGERVGEVQEEQNLTAIICKLTDGQPVDVCRQVKDLVDEIKSN